LEYNLHRSVMCSFFLFRLNVGHSANYQETETAYSVSILPNPKGEK
jgi:hypothetical protein